MPGICWEFIHSFAANFSQVLSAMATKCDAIGLVFFGGIFMRQEWKSFLKDDSGATAIEYGIIVGLIGVAVVVSIGGVKDKLLVLFELIQAALQVA